MLETEFDCGAKVRWKGDTNPDGHSVGIIAGYRWIPDSLTYLVVWGPGMSDWHLGVELEEITEESSCSRY